MPGNDAQTPNPQDLLKITDIAQIGLIRTVRVLQYFKGHYQTAIVTLWVKSHKVRFYKTSQLSRKQK